MTIIDSITHEKWFRKDYFWGSLYVYNTGLRQYRYLGISENQQRVFNNIKRK